MLKSAKSRKNTIFPTYFVIFKGLHLREPKMYEVILNSFREIF